jgi:hypothetical protein
MMAVTEAVDLVPGVDRCRGIGLWLLGGQGFEMSSPRIDEIVDD